MGPLKQRGACARFALLAVLAVLAWTAVHVHFQFAGNWTGLFCTGLHVPLPPELANTYRMPDGGYDGQFYRLLAHDPFLNKHYWRYADAPSYRFRRAMLPLAAWALALGQPRWIDGAYIAWEFVFIGLGVYWTARIVARRGRAPAWGLLFVLLPATLTSFDRMLVDGPVTALFAGFFLYCEEEKWGRVWLLAALAALTRETALLLTAALVLDRLRRFDWRGSAIFAMCAAPALAWYGFVAAHMPPYHGLGNLGLPLLPIIQRLLWLRPYFDPLGQVILRVTDLLALGGLLVCVALAILWLRERSWSVVSISVALYVCLTLILNKPVLESAFAYGRVVSPLLLWVEVEAVAKKRFAILTAPLLVSLNAGLVFVRPMIDIARALLPY